MPTAEAVLARLLRDARLARNLKQEEVARMAGVGTSSLRAIEAGTAHGPSLYTTLRLLQVLGVDPYELQRVSEALTSSTEDDDRERR